MTSGNRQDLMFLAAIAIAVLLLWGWNVTHDDGPVHPCNDGVVVAQTTDMNGDIVAVCQQVHR